MDSAPLKGHPDVQIIVMIFLAILVRGFGQCSEPKTEDGVREDDYLQ